MLYDVDKQIQEAIDRGDLEDLPGKGKRQELEENAYVPRETRIVNQMLKENGFAPRWIEVDKEIRAEREQSKKLLGNIKRRRRYLEAAIHANSLKSDRVRRVFELERARVLAAYITQLKGINQKILRYNLTAPGRGRQKSMVNLNATVARFREECPSL
jgi:DnaJ family protein C protein 28